MRRVVRRRQRMRLLLERCDCFWLMDVHTHFITYWSYEKVNNLLTLERCLKKVNIFIIVQRDDNIVKTINLSTSIMVVYAVKTA